MHFSPTLSWLNLEQARATKGVTKKKLIKLALKSEDITALVSTHNLATAVMIDPSSNKKTLWEQRLCDVESTVRDDFVYMKQEYSPPSHLSHLQDKKELSVVFSDTLSRLCIEGTEEEKRSFIETFIAEGTAVAEGWPAWSSPEWMQLVNDMGDKSSYLDLSVKHVRDDDDSRDDDTDVVATAMEVDAGGAESAAACNASEQPFEALDAAYVPLAAINLHARMEAAQGAISLSDGTVDSFADPEPEMEAPVDEACSYPLCSHEGGDIKLVKCGVHGCTAWLHHLCAAAQGDDAFPPRCFIHLMEEVPSGTQVEDFPQCIQTADLSLHHLCAAQGDDEFPRCTQKHRERDAKDRSISDGSEANDSDVPGTPMPSTPVPSTPGKKEKKEEGDVMQGTPPTPVGQKPEVPPQFRRLSPAFSRGSPHQSTTMYGACRGELVPQPPDNSCFYHAARYTVQNDPDLMRDKQSLAFIGSSTNDLRKNIRSFCEGRLICTSEELSQTYFDLRVGNPPTDDKCVPGLEQYARETLDDLAASVADVESIAAYGKEVAKSTHWGTEIDLLVMAVATNRVWQFGNVTKKSSGNWFIPTLQAAPVGYDFSLREDVCRLVFNGRDHFDVWQASTPPIDGIASDTELESGAESDVEEKPVAPSPAKIKVQTNKPAKKLSLIDALAKKPAHLAEAELDDLLKQSEDAAMQAEVAVELASTPLSQLLASTRARHANNEVTRARVHSEAFKQYMNDPAMRDLRTLVDANGARYEKAAQMSSMAAISSLFKKWARRTANITLNARKSEKAAQVAIKRKISSSFKQWAGRTAINTLDASKSSYRAITTTNAQMQQMQQMQETMEALKRKHEQDLAEMRTTMALEARRREEERRKEERREEERREEQRKLAVAEKRREDKRQELAPAERRKTDAKLAEERQELAEEHQQLDQVMAESDQQTSPFIVRGGKEYGNVKLSVGDIISMTFGSRSRKMGVVTAKLGSGAWRVDLDNGDLVEVVLEGPNAKAFQKVDHPPCEMVRFKSNESYKIFNKERSTIASLAEIPSSDCDQLTCFTVTDSMEMFKVPPSTKSSNDWLDACGIGHLLFVPSLGGSSQPKPMDLRAVVRFPSASKEGSKERPAPSTMQVHIGNVLSYDILTKEPLQASEKAIGVPVGVYGAGANQEVAIQNKFDLRRWNMSAQSTHVYLDVRALNGDINSYSETIFIPCETPTDLASKIGMSAYMQVVRAVSGHPLYKPLIDAQWVEAMECQDILTALRALADGMIRPRAAEILAKHIVDTAAKSVSKPIERRYESLTEGIQKKDENRAISDYKKKVNQVLSLLSPGATEVSKLMPKVQSRTLYSQLFTQAQANNTPILPKVITKTRTASSASSASVSPALASAAAPTPDALISGAPAPGAPKSAALVPTSAALVPQSRARRPRSSLVPASTPDADAPASAADSLALASAAPAADASACARKSSLTLAGSPHKADGETADGKRVKVCAFETLMHSNHSLRLKHSLNVHEIFVCALCVPQSLSPEELAECINSLPQVATRLSEAAALFTTMGSDVVATKERQINSLQEQLKTALEKLERANEKIAKLEADKAELVQRQMDAAVSAARAEGQAEQLREAINSKDRQLESWVSRRFCQAEHALSFFTCDASGSVLP